MLPLGTMPQVGVPLDHTRARQRCSDLPALPSDCGRISLGDEGRRTILLH
jgi:hypothetical protein